MGTNEFLRISQNGWSAEIDPMGGWLVSLKYDDQDVIFPRTQVEQPDGSSKTRGGSHVCYPNFGPDASGEFAQHGFARTSLWDIVDEESDHVFLALPGQGEYTQVETLLEYRLAADGLVMALSIHNYGGNAVKIAPAFHPYFAPVALASTIKLSAENLPEWVTWTDRSSDYVCVEPTAVGDGFSNGRALPLEAGETWQGSLKIDL